MSVCVQCGQGPQVCRCPAPVRARTMAGELVLPEQLANRVARGRKTLHAHRARWSQRTGDYLPCPFPAGSVAPVCGPVASCTECSWTGVPQQGRCGNPKCGGFTRHDVITHVEVAATRHMTIRQLVAPQIDRLGFDSEFEFRESWLAQHDAAWLAQVDPDDRAMQITQRFLNRWAPRPIWLVTIAVTEAPVYLTENPGGQLADYTTDPGRAMRGEPPVIPEQLQSILAMRSAAKADQARRDRQKPTEDGKPKRGNTWTGRGRDSRRAA